MCMCCIVDLVYVELKSVACTTNEAPKYCASVIGEGSSVISIGDTRTSPYLHTLLIRSHTAFSI